MALATIPFVDLERGCAETVDSLPRYPEQSSRFAPLPSKKSSAKAAWNVSRKLSGCAKMQATIEFVSRYVTQQVKQLDVMPPVSFAMHAKLIPSYYLDRVARRVPSRVANRFATSRAAPYPSV